MKLASHRLEVYQVLRLDQIYRTVKLFPRHYKQLIDKRMLDAQLIVISYIRHYTFKHLRPLGRI